MCKYKFKFDSSTFLFWWSQRLSFKSVYEFGHFVLLLDPSMMTVETSTFNSKFEKIRCIKESVVHLSRDMTKPAKWVCAQRRRRSAWVSAQSDQSLRYPQEETLGPQLPIKRTAKILIRLCECPGSFSLRWAHSHFVGFVMRRLIYIFHLLVLLPNVAWLHFAQWCKQFARWCKLVY